jgi:hypothetical protein
MDVNRRKLLQGSAAVPLILTVRPAAAHARASLSCMDKDTKREKPYSILKSSGSPDEWMRKKIGVYQLAVWDEHKKKWETLENRRFIHGVDGDSYWELDRHSPHSAPALRTSMTRGTGIQETKLEERMALAYFGDDGDLRGYGWEDHGGKHCTTSCWNSLKPRGY